MVCCGAPRLNLSPWADSCSNSEANAKVMPSIDLNDPVAVLVAASQALERANLEAAAYGGLALAVLLEEGVPSILRRTAGFDVILAFDRLPFGGQLVSRLTLIGGSAGSLNTADLVEPRSPRYAQQVLARSLAGSLRQQPLRVVSPEDFVVMKILATRERDVEDAVTLVRSLAKRLDMELIERELGALAIEISDYDVMGRWQHAQSRFSSGSDEREG